MRRLGVLACACGLLLILAAIVLFLVVRKSNADLREYKSSLAQRGESLDLQADAPKTTSEPHAFHQACAELRKFRDILKLPDGPELPAQSRSKLEALQSKYDVAQPLVKQVVDLARTPVPEFHPGYDRFIPFLNTLLDFSGSADLLAIDSELSLSKGNAATASDNIIAILAITELLQKQPHTMSQMGAAGMAIRARNATAKFLRSGLADSPELARLQAAWEKIDLLSIAPQTLRMQRARELQSDGLPFGKKVASLTGEMYDPHSPISTGERISATITVLGSATIFRPTDELLLIQNYQRLIDTKSPSSSHIASAYLDTAHSLVEKMRNHALLYNSGKASQLENDLISTTIGQANAELSITALALQRFFLDHGENPEALADIVPTYTRRVPIDFFDGEPLRYRRVAPDEFLLYSIGANRKDDNGSDTPLPDFDSQKMDIVWPKPAKKPITP